MGCSLFMLCIEMLRGQENDDTQHTVIHWKLWKIEVNGRAVNLAMENTLKHFHNPQRMRNMLAGIISNRKCVKTKMVHQPIFTRTR